MKVRRKPAYQEKEYKPGLVSPAVAAILSAIIPLGTGCPRAAIRSASILVTITIPLLFTGFPGPRPCFLILFPVEFRFVFQAAF